MIQSTTIERSAVNTALPYRAAIAAFERAIGRLDSQAAGALSQRAAPWHEVEAAMAQMAGPSGLMLFTHYDQGSIASLAGEPIYCRLYLVGNPAIAARIVRIDVRGSLYVPFRVAIFEQREQSGAVIMFDRPSSFLGVLNQPGLTDIGRQLDAKIDAVVQRVCDGAAEDAHAKPSG
jgi:uncharacterized protein (DUF302 family)